MMSTTSLTVGGFTQQGVARSLIEIPSNSEKGFSHRFLWLFPNPLYKKISTLGEVDKEFLQKISMQICYPIACAPIENMRTTIPYAFIFAANLYAKQWRKPAIKDEELSPKVFHITPNSPVFGEYYDRVQELLQSMAGMDELLQG